MAVEGNGEINGKPGEIVRSVVGSLQPASVPSIDQPMSEGQLDAMAHAVRDSIYGEEKMVNYASRQPAEEVKITDVWGDHRPVD